MRVFLAHSKGTTDLEIQRLSEELKLYFSAMGKDVEVVAGVDDFNLNIGSDGTFDAWARNVPVRMDTFTGQRVYSVFAVPGREMGKATALIIQKALEAGAEVYSVEWVGDDIELHYADAVVEVDARDFFRGWLLSVPGIA